MEDTHGNELLIAQHTGYNQGYVQAKKDLRTGQVLWLSILLLPVVWAATYVHGDTVRECFANALYALGAEITLGGLSLLIKRG